MQYSFAISLLSLADQSFARHGKLKLRMDAEECCPCPASGAPETVTVTAEGPPAKTTYISDGPQTTVTVVSTVTESACTVFITHEPDLAATKPKQDHPKTLTKTTYPAHSSETPGTDNLDEGAAEKDHGGKGTGDKDQGDSKDADDHQQDADNNYKVIIKTIYPESVTNSHENEKGKQLVTKVLHHDPAELPKGPKTVTVIASPPKEAPTQPSVVTVTVEPQEPSFEAITKAIDNPVTVTSARVHDATTIVKSEEHYKTVTQTVSSGGGDIDIEIIIINSNTGETECRKKDSGEPCDSSGKPSLSTVCASVEPSTSISTAFNTVTVTASQNMHLKSTMHFNSTMPFNSTVMGVLHPTGMRRAMREPLSPRWWEE